MAPPFGTLRVRETIIHFEPSYPARGRCAALPHTDRTIIAIDFASHYCVSLGNSAHTRPNLKTDT